MISHDKAKLEISSENLTSDAGLILITKYLNKRKTEKIFNKIIFNDNRKKPDYSNNDILSFKLVNKFAGYNSQTLQSRAVEDTLFTKFMKVPSQSTISRMHKRISQETIDTFADENIKFCKSSIDKLDVVILDGDSTNIVCHGKQEGSTHNAHYNNHGFSMLAISEHNTGLVLAADLREGKTHCAKGIDEMLSYVVDKLELNNRNVMFRADSQFANAGRIQAYDSLGLSYAIKMMRRDKKLESIIETKTNECINFQSFKNAKDPIYGSLRYMSKSLGEVKIYFKSEIAADDDQILLFHDYQIIVSNIDDTPENIFQFYNMRGASENIFRELKNDFGGSYMSHTNLIENKFEMLFSIFSYNVYKKMINEIAPELTGLTLCTFTRDYIKIAAKIVKHARIIHIKLDLGYRRISEFMKIYNRI